MKIDNMRTNQANIGLYRYLKYITNEQYLTERKQYKMEGAFLFQIINTYCFFLFYYYFDLIQVVESILV